ncbi:MAG: CHC2 zinc finger domain-containing protein [Candidatus Moraniibacteriota bacterium]
MKGTCTFHCFGCGHSGDVFDFVHDFLEHRCNGGDKVKTYKWFKKNYNIPLPWEKSDGAYIYC